MADQDYDYKPPDLMMVELHMEYFCRRDCEHEVVEDIYRTRDNELHGEIGRCATRFELREEHAQYVRGVNSKFETPLHLAALCFTSESGPLLGKLLKMGANVNARNTWGQTALHYASFASLNNIMKLVSFKGIDVNIQDCNGYNALHCLLTSYKEAVPVLKSVHLLIQAGLNINSQTNYGNSILHLAAERKDESQLLESIVTKFPEIDLNIKNKFGDNFLHVYVERKQLDDVLNLFSNLITIKGESSLQRLLNDQNNIGKTPWSIMIDENGMTATAMNKCLKYGISISVQDCMGNTLLHGIAGGELKVDLLKVIMKHIEDMKISSIKNIENIFGEPAVSMININEMFEIFWKHGMNFNIRDRWGRNSLVSIMKHNPKLDLVLGVITKGNVDVNSRDEFASTPLHFAAYHNFPDHVQLLLDYGADINARDKLGDTPLQTCLRHSSFRCLKILSRQIEERTLPKTLQYMPKQIKSSQIRSTIEVRRLLGLPKDSNFFLSEVLNEYYKQPAHNSIEYAERNQINLSVNILIKDLCLQMNKYDPIFQLSVHPTGSISEGTKVGRPDEFDFVLSFDDIVKVTEPAMTKRCAESNFVCLRFTESPVREEYLPFSDRDRFFLAFPLLQYFFRYLKQALNEAHLWREGNLYYNSEDKVGIIDGKPVFNFNVYWVGSVYKQLKISVDIVPGVYMPGFWPLNIDSKMYYDEDGKRDTYHGIRLMTEDIQRAGCFLIFQTKNLDFEKRKNDANDNISSTCNEYENTEDFPRRRMLRVSAAPAEISLMKSLPEKFRKAYALAKIVKSADVCPEIELDEFPKHENPMTNWKKPFKEKIHLPVKAYEKAKSYMLKNCLFYIYQEMSARNQNMDEITVPDITTLMYHYLLHLADEQTFKPYFLPYCNIFETEENKSSYTGFMYIYERELSIKLALAILNNPFPWECLARITDHRCMSETFQGLDVGDR